MRYKAVLIFFTTIILSEFCASLTSCKSCKKSEPVSEIKTDTSIAAPQVQHIINLPHADSALIPVLSKVLDAAFAASTNKDYKNLASLIVYRGPDTQKFGSTVFDAKNNYDKNVLRITADVFNTWNTAGATRDYIRVFEMDQPEGMKMPVLEVLFISNKNMDRKFFGFLKINEEWKIADVTSYL